MTASLWQQCLNRLQDELPSAEFSMWIRPLQAELSDNTLTLYAPGEGGGETLGADFHVPLLGKLPLDLRIRQGLDAGQPIVVADPESPISQQYRDIALKVAAAIAAKGRDMSHKFPKIVVE